MIGTKPPAGGFVVPVVLSLDARHQGLTLAQIGGQRNRARKCFAGFVLPAQALQQFAMHGMQGCVGLQLPRFLLL